MALDGRSGERPITKVSRPALVPTLDLVSEFAELITAGRRGVILAGRQHDPGIAAAVAALSDACGYPVLPEPTSQLRAGTHSLENVVAHYDAIFRALPDRLAPELVVRVGDMVTSKAVRTWLTAHRECRQVVVDPTDAWNEPTASADLIARAEPGLLFESFAEQMDRRPDRSWLEAWRDADRAAGAGDRRIPGQARRRALRAARPPPSGGGAARDEHRLRGLQHAGARSGELPAAGGPAVAVSRQPGRERDRWAGLIRPRGGCRRARADVRAARRSRALPRHERPAGLRAARRRSDARGAQQRRGRDLRLPAGRKASGGL